MSFSRLLIFMALALFVSCASDAKKDASETATAENSADRPATMTQANQTNNSSSIVKDINLPNTPTSGPAIPPPGTKEPPQNAAGVWHYTCAKGCPGGGGAATKCATCGDLLKHNSAYHAGTTPPGGQAGAQPAGQIQNLTNPMQQQQLTQPTSKPVEPAQNAAGVWHFTCAQGCAGGSGDRAAKCGGCGGALAHNQVYHQ